MSNENVNPTEIGEPGRGRRRGPGHHHREGRGRGPQRDPFGFGFGPFGPRGPLGPRGARRERGDVRAAILLLLAEQPRHGYEILTELADRSDGQWRPSPGSVYPVLKRLAQAGLVEPTQENGRRVFRLTDEGRKVIETEGASWGEPWAQSESGDTQGLDALWNETKQMMAALWQVGQLGDPAMVESATGLVVDARKKVYGLLAQ